MKRQHDIRLYTTSALRHPEQLGASPQPRKSFLSMGEHSLFVCLGTCAQIARRFTAVLLIRNSFVERCLRMRCRRLGALCSQLLYGGGCVCPLQDLLRVGRLVSPKLCLVHYPVCTYLREWIYGRFRRPSSVATIAALCIVRMRRR